MHIFQKCKTSHENVCFKSFSGFSLSIQCTPNFLCGLYDLVFAPLFKLLSPSSIRSDALDIPNYWQFPEQNLLSPASFLPLHGDTLLFSCLLAEMSSPVGTSPWYLSWSVLLFSSRVKMLFLQLSSLVSLTRPQLALFHWPMHQHQLLMLSEKNALNRYLLDK